MQKVFYDSNDVRVLTLKHENYQNIDKVAKHVKKISDTFFLVREKNKKDVGYHYHAILVVKKEPPRSWFRKGVHIHLTKLGRFTQDLKGFVPPIPEMNSRDISEVNSHDPQEAEAILIDKVARQTYLKFQKKEQRLKYVRGVIKYLTKEFINPIQYVDYVYQIGRTNHTLNLPTGGGLMRRRPQAALIEGGGA